MAGMAMVVCLFLVATLAATELAAAQGGGFGGGGPGGGGFGGGPGGGGGFGGGPGGGGGFGGGPGGGRGGGGGGGFGGGRAADCQDFVDACRDYARFNQRFPGRYCCQATNRVSARCLCRVDSNLRGRYLAIPRACGISFGSPNCGFDEADESKP